MLLRTTITVLIGSLVLTTTLSSAVWATSSVPSPTLSTAVANPGSNYITPAGSGERMDGSDGSTDVSVEVQVMYVGPEGPEPVAAYPFQDVYLDTITESTLDFCHNGSAADAFTNGEGRTWIRRALSGGGSAEGGVTVFLGGTPIATTLEGLRFNSADINGDRRVDLADVAIFASDFNGEYHWRSDFEADGMINMVDVSLLATALGEECP